MTSVRRRWTFVLTGVFLATLVALAAAILLPAWQARHRAAALLAALRELHPGFTTEVQARALLMPLARYAESSAGAHSQEVSYSFYNMGQPGSIAGRVLPLAAALHVNLPWTLFEVAIRYQDGMLSEIHLVEMQEDFVGGPHPNSASTTILSTRFGQQLGYVPSLNSDFNGYSVYARSTGATDANGNWTGFSCCHARFVTLDERATPTQHTDSLNFQLHCLTSWRRCRDDRKILP